MEEEYGFDLVLRYEVCWRFLLMMGICVNVEIVFFFVSRIWFWAYVRSGGLWCDFCEKKRLRKKIGICYGCRGVGLLGFIPSH